MKQFLAFAGDRYYPFGGWSDFKGDFDTLDEAKTAASAEAEVSSTYCWGHVVDTSKRDDENLLGVIVWEK